MLQSPDRSPLELKTIEDWVVERQYKSVPGVADDSGFGGETMQYQVLLDPAKIAGAGLSVPQVVTALAANNGNAGGGFYSQGGQFYYVRGLGRLHTPEDIGNVVLAVRNGIPTFVKDIGRVVIGHAPRLGQFGYQDQDDAVEGVILMRTGEQAQDVLKRVQAKTEELNRNILPKDVKILPFYDRSDLISLTTETVESNLLRGMVLVVIVLVFFLYDVRAGADRRCRDSVRAAVRLHLPRPARHSGEPALDRRDRLRHSGRRRGGDGGEHLSRIAARPGQHALSEVIAGGRRSGPADLLRRRGHHRWLPADLRLVRAFGQTLHADGRHDDLRARRLAARHADAAAGAVSMGFSQRRTRKTQPRLRRRQIRLYYGPRFLPRVILGQQRSVRCCCLPARCCSFPFIGAEFMPHLDEGALWVRATMPYTISFEESSKIAPQSPRDPSLLSAR